MNVDVNILREAVTVMSFVAFVGIVAFAAFPGNESRFNEAARIPLDDEEPLPPPEPSPRAEGPNVGPGFREQEHR
jgi:cytochrome c oxidase cbb3-type subunit 4